MDDRSHEEPLLPANEGEYEERYIKLAASFGDEEEEFIHKGLYEQKAALISRELECVLSLETT